VFDLEEERLKEAIVKSGAERVLLQFPEGLKTESLRIARIVEEVGALPIISANPCYGACDLAIDTAQSLDVDLIIHYGHTKFLKHEQIPTLYIEAKATLNVNGIIEEALPKLEKWHRIGLATTVQHLQNLDEAREKLVHAGKTVIIGDSGLMKYPGQIIGCNYSNVKSIAGEVEAFLFIGGGLFHGIGLALSTSKPTIVANPFENRVYSVDKEAEKIRKQRWASIKKAKKAKTFGILIGLKPGQKKWEEAWNLKGKLEKKDKMAYLLSIREITPEVLIAFQKIDAYVNTACPRISIDYSPKFQKPVLTINETLVIVNELTWEELCKKGFFEKKI
jgi:2-(3-amino-3-carboxypropyl)histidine synthase